MIQAYSFWVAVVLVALNAVAGLMNLIQHSQRNQTAPAVFSGVFALLCGVAAAVLIINSNNVTLCLR